MERGPEAPDPGPQSPAPSYTGPVPPGGWEQPQPAQSRPGPAIAGGALAGWGSRFAAWIVDKLVLLVPGALLFVLIVGSQVGLRGDDDFSWFPFVLSMALFFVVFAAVSIVYEPLTMARGGQRNGQTWGKQILGIRVVRNDGQQVTFGFGALREIVVKGIALGIASMVVPLLPSLLNYLWPLWDDENRALHDFVVSTHVVRA